MKRDEKHSREVEPHEKQSREADLEDSRVRRRENASVRKLAKRRYSSAKYSKVAHLRVSPMIRESEGSKKVGPLKRRVQSCEQRKHEKLQRRCGAKQRPMSKKCHVLVVRSAFSTQNTQSRPSPDHFLKF